MPFLLILATLPQLCALIPLIVDSGGWNQSSSQVGAQQLIMHDSLSILPNTKNYITWHQSGLCQCLCSFIPLGSQSFLQIIIVHDPFFIVLSISSKMARFSFISAVICRWKFGPLYFSLLIHVAPKYKAPFCIQPYANSLNVFFGWRLNP